LFSPICVHSCVPTSVHNSATAQQCTQTPQSGAERPDPPICVHYCDPKATHNPSPRPNSVHKCPNPARRGPILPFVYTIAIPRPLITQAHSPTVYTNAPKRRRGAVLANLCTLLRSHNCTRDRAGPPVPRRRRPHGPRDARALGPEAHTAKAVAQPSTYTNSRSLL